MPRPPTITRAEHDALAAAVEALAKQIEADRAMRKETHAMITGLHRALIEPEPGHKHGLLHRMAAVTIAAETGQAMGARIILWATVVGAVSVIIGAIGAVVHFGQTKGG